MCVCVCVCVCVYGGEYNACERAQAVACPSRSLGQYTGDAMLVVVGLGTCVLHSSMRTYVLQSYTARMRTYDLQRADAMLVVARNIRLGVCVRVSMC
jgi:hypothetical protein